MVVWVEVTVNENLVRKVVFEHPDCLRQAVVATGVGKALKSCYFAARVSAEGVEDHPVCARPGMLGIPVDHQLSHLQGQQQNLQA